MDPRPGAVPVCRSAPPEPDIRFRCAEVRLPRGCCHTSAHLNEVAVPPEEGRQLETSATPVACAMMRATISSLVVFSPGRLSLPVPW